MKSKWTKQEKQNLKKQVESGIPLSDLRITGRSYFSIRYKVYDMKINFLRWKKDEITLLGQLIRSGKKLWEINIPGRSEIAIRNKAIRLGLWKTKKRSIKPWTIRETKLLARLVKTCGYTTKMIITNGYFSNRSIDSINQQKRRMRIKK